MTKFKQGLNRVLRLLFFPVWMTMHIVQYIFLGTDIKTVYVNIGSMLLKMGSGISVGQPVYIPSPRGTKRLAYVKNAFYNFRQNAITATYDSNPIPGFTEGKKLKKPRKKFVLKNPFKSGRK